jgi:hypothetical protein
MKKNAGIYFIAASFVITIVGSVLKIEHASDADWFLGAGIVTICVGIVILIYTFINKRST